jgi:23S rRNA (cytosine1962-C5)-methyltransferase
MILLPDLLAKCLAARAELFDERHESALRLFNGFLEGDPDLAVDLYGRSLVLHNYADDSNASGEKIQAAWQFMIKELPWLQAVLVKSRGAGSESGRLGQLVAGTALDSKICENGVWYALDLAMHQDTSLYLDTRGLRAWAKHNLQGKTVLNTFAYTGSLGVAALSGGAYRVVQLDLNRRFLNLAKTSYTLNGFPLDRADFITGDFWNEINVLKRHGQLFDCVFLDPPFFALSGRGKIDQVSESQRLINKVRPLVADGGWLVVVNNALFLSGQDYHTMLENLCAGGYLKIESLIAVPPDATGYPETVVRVPPTPPAPFNHSTKIAVLRVKRKDLIGASTPLANAHH